jgi:cytochrome P450
MPTTIYLITFCRCVLFLLHEPEHQERIHRELRASYDHPPSYRDRAAAPFVQAVIMESQRLGNIVPFAITHGATTDTTLFGYEIKKGVKMSSLELM